MVTRVVLVLALSLAAACLPKTYHCSSNNDCGAAGVCQANNFCSFSDQACSSGQRYGDLSGPYTGQCVGETDGGLPIDGPAMGSDAMADGMIDSPLTPPPFCDTADTTLVGCWQFENDLNDASGHNNNGVGTSVTFAAGQTGMAAVLGSASHIAVADSVSLTPTQITIEGWINPTSLPTTGLRMGVLDGDGKYGLFVYPGQIECFCNVTVIATVALNVSTWTHVACTYTGTTGTIYVNGSAIGTTAGGVALGAGTANGIALGGNSPSADTLVGMIDQYRVFNLARTAGQICSDAGHTSCP